MKNILAALLLVTVLVSGCAATSSSVTDATTTTVNGVTATTVAQSSGSVKEFTMTAKQFEFAPSTITVKEGDTEASHNQHGCDPRLFPAGLRRERSIAGWRNQGRGIRRG